MFKIAISICNGFMSHMPAIGIRECDALQRILLDYTGGGSREGSKDERTPLLLIISEVPNCKDCQDIGPISHSESAAI